MTAVSGEAVETANLRETKQLEVHTYPGALEGRLFDKHCRVSTADFPSTFDLGSPPHSYFRFCCPSQQLLSFEEFVKIWGFGKS